MTTELQDLYATYTPEQLFNVVINDSEYHPVAIDVARKIIEEKNLTTDFKKYLEENQLEIQEEDKQQSTAYYKDLLDFKDNYKYFDLKLEDVARFEQKLIEYKVPFYKEKELVEVRNRKEPIQAYLFKNEHVEQVEKIIVELDIIPQSLHDKPGLYKFETITILILLITIVLMMFLQ